MEDRYDRAIIVLSTKDMEPEKLMWHGVEVKVTKVWYVDSRYGVTIEPVGGFGFPVDVYIDEFVKGQEVTK